MTRKTFSPILCTYVRSTHSNQCCIFERPNLNSQRSVCERIKNLLDYFNRETEEPRNMFDFPSRVSFVYSVATNLNLWAQNRYWMKNLTKFSKLTIQKKKLFWYLVLFLIKVNSASLWRSRIRSTGWIRNWVDFWIQWLTNPLFRYYVQFFKLGQFWPFGGIKVGSGSLNRGWIRNMIWLWKELTQTTSIPTLFNFPSQVDFAHLKGSHLDLGGQ